MLKVEQYAFWVFNLSLAKIIRIPKYHKFAKVKFFYCNPSPKHYKFLHATLHNNPGNVDVVGVVY
jgi:hypothetical protein